jgi:hypothetical protein
MQRRKELGPFERRPPLEERIKPKVKRTKGCRRLAEN